ncbi:family 16 glycosylhydrolase [Flammeovirga sp. MY04]|uniref:family 16 glycosylhydrolase n=1 Tax=Flammeovirga sp. MY04 TaxID=1191459 RepID=UPI00080632D9|nr:family 16 glycosylhydrolase [Flammeovirga sp. MY04]ANQ52454.1 family 16 glycosylhydrolase [Flammeovirga sp. MY04]
MKNEFYFLTILFLIFGCAKDNSQVQKEEKVIKHQPFIVASNQKTIDLGNEWIEVWSDEFDGTSLDTSKWTKTVSTKSRAARPELGIKSWFWVEDHAWLNGNGQLVLKSSKVTTDKMYCGSVDSRGKYEPKYGYMEARIKIADTSKGNHTAFWLQGKQQGNVDGTGNDGAEIDIFESAWTSDYTKSVIHIDGYAADHKANTKKYDTPNIHDGYHIYGLLWDENKLEIYYDGEHKVTYEGIWVPQVKEWLWLSVGASFGDGDFVSQPIGDLSIAEVDYVRVWERDPLYQSPNTSDIIRLRNKESNFYFRVRGEGDDVEVQQTDNSRTGDWTHWKLVENTAPYYYIKNEGTQKLIRSLVNENNAQVYTKPLENTGSWTQWEFIYVGEGYFLIKNKETKKYLRASSLSNDSPIVLGTATDNYAQWKIETLE